MSLVAWKKHVDNALAGSLPKLRFVYSNLFTYVFGVYSAISDLPKLFHLFYHSLVPSGYVSQHLGNKVHSQRAAFILHVLILHTKQVLPSSSCFIFHLKDRFAGFWLLSIFQLLSVWSDCLEWFGRRFYIPYGQGTI